MPYVVQKGLRNGSVRPGVGCLCGGFGRAGPVRGLDNPNQSTAYYQKNAAVAQDEPRETKT